MISIKKELFGLLVFLWCGSLHIHAQVLSNDVINSGGQNVLSPSPGISLTDNIGEPFTELLGPVGQMMVSQGFLQPELTNGITILKNDPTCTGRADGYISVAFSTLNKKHAEEYIWSPASACAGGNCGNRISNLAPGVYSLSIVSTFTLNNGEVKRDTLLAPPVVINPSAEPCRLKVFTGVTPNNDGRNDVWIIENIHEFPSNNVSVYSRWGNLMFETSGYDNESNNWPSADHLNNVVSGTYFYIIELGDGSRPMKGWIEVLKN